MRPPIPYFGGKQRIAEQIVATFPEHTHYVEPYAGSLSVLLAKPPAAMETVNDLDGDLMTFWRVLRDRPDELVTAAMLTPHSRAELAAARRRDDNPDDLERARRVWVELTQGRSAKVNTGWRFYLDGGSSASSLPRYLTGYLQRMPPAAARLIEVSLESRPAREVILDYGNTAGTLLYVDPPYLGSTRASGGYRHEMKGENEHRELLFLLTGCKARVVLSGYRSPLYDDTLAGWEQVEIQASTSQMASREKSARTEVLWCNFAPQEHLFSNFGEHEKEEAWRRSGH